MIDESYRAVILGDRVVSVDTGAKGFSNLLAILGILLGKFSLGGVS